MTLSSQKNCQVTVCKLESMLCSDYRESENCDYASILENHDGTPTLVTI